MQVGNEQLVELGKRNSQAPECGYRAATSVDDEFVAIAEFHEPARRSLSAPDWRVPRADGRDPHLVRRQHFLFRHEVLRIGFQRGYFLPDNDRRLGQRFAA
jgi:hypothetical protein